MARSHQPDTVDAYDGAVLRAGQESVRLKERPSQPFVRIVNDPAAHVIPTLSSLAGKRGKFYLCIGSTHTSDIPGISAAGVSPEMRRLTPCTDAEALLLGRAVTAGTIPVSPAGVASPVVITRACLKLLQMPVEVVDCGSFASPQTEYTDLGGRPANCLSTGQAMTVDEAERLFSEGLAHGRAAGSAHDYLVLGECVPGGTTTAMGVLNALGFDARRMLSSSLPNSDHDFRYELVRRGLQASGLSEDDVAERPLSAVAMVGDPMQPFVAGMALAASLRVPVILAGGSQMLAVYALMQAVAIELKRMPLAPPIVATTKWVAFDKSADTAALSRMIHAPYVAACPQFDYSRHGGLQLYEQGNVKEGAGAGGSMVVAHAAGGFPADQLLSAIDECYDELVVRNQTALF